MSVNYASGLSPYPDKGACGMKEKFESQEELTFKLEQLSELVGNSKHLVVITGAGISTSAGIPDFRGPKGVWTLEEKGITPQVDVTFETATPTFTHMALVALQKQGILKYLISQNIDGLHVRSGFPRDCLSELHGNMFVEECDHCRTQIIRAKAVPTMALRYTGSLCTQQKRMGKCRGRLKDTILDWEHALPERELTLADDNCREADVCLCLGTSLQILPCGSMPLLCRKRGGKVVIVNLQATKRDKHCDLRVYAYVDDVMRHICAKLGVLVPGWAKPHVVLRSHNPSTTSRLPAIEVDQELLVDGLESVEYSEQFPVNSYSYKSAIESKDPSLFSNELNSSKCEEKTSQSRKIKRRNRTTRPKTNSPLTEKVEDDNDFYKIEIFTDEGDMVESLYVSPNDSTVQESKVCKVDNDVTNDKGISDMTDSLPAENVTLGSQIKPHISEDSDNSGKTCSILRNSVSDCVIDNEGPIVIDSDSDDGSQTPEVKASSPAHNVHPGCTDLTIASDTLIKGTGNRTITVNNSHVLTTRGDCPVHLDSKQTGFSQGGDSESLSVIDKFNNCDSTSRCNTDTDLTDHDGVAVAVSSVSHSGYHDNVSDEAGLSSAGHHYVSNDIDACSSPTKKLKITDEK